MNPLQAGTPPPPPPEQTNQLASMPQDGPQQPQPQGAAQGGQPGQAPPPAPAPTHGQTAAALRHFQAVMGELRGLLTNPDLGKADIKSAIIDGATKLVANRIISPAQAVMQLSTVPERPFDQKKWIETQYTQAVQAQSAVLDHHRATNPGTGDYATEAAMHQSDPDQHMATMDGMMQAHYGGRRGA